MIFMTMMTIMMLLTTASTKIFLSDSGIVQSLISRCHWDKCNYDNCVRGHPLMTVLIRFVIFCYLGFVVKSFWIPSPNNFNQCNVTQYPMIHDPWLTQSFQFTGQGAGWTVWGVLHSAASTKTFQGSGDKLPGLQSETRTPQLWSRWLLLLLLWWPQGPSAIQGPWHREDWHQGDTAQCVWLWQVILQT